jgi:hypothetical protein
MRILFTLASALLAYATTVYATALTYRLEAHEKACFFASVENKGTKLAFYFAVRLPICNVAFAPSNHVQVAMQTCQVPDRSANTLDDRSNPVVLST